MQENMKKRYHTEGKARLLDFLSAHPDCQFSTEELCLHVNGTMKGKSSIYRHLTDLCREVTVRRFRNEERGCSVYQYVGEACDCDHHFHGKCIRCGRLEHLDCDESEAFVKHLFAEHGFAVNCGGSLLYGLCAACRTAAEGGTR